MEPLAAEEKTVEEARSPLHVLQSVLTSAASKLVILEGMRWLQQAVDGRDQRWHGLLRKSVAKHVAGGR